MSKVDQIKDKLKKDAPERLNVKLKAVGHKMMEYLLNKGEKMLHSPIIQEVSDGSYASLVFLVPKKGEATFRIVIDMRALNQIYVKTVLSLPHLEC